MTVTIKNFDAAHVRPTSTNGTGLVALGRQVRPNPGPAMSEED